MPVDDKQVEYHLERLNALSRRRSGFESLWQDVSDYLMPWKASVTSEQSPGSKRTSLIYDSTPIYALNILASGLMGHLTSEAAPWFRLICKDYELQHNEDVRNWLMDITRQMISTLSGSNFYTVIQEFYEDLCGFCTAHIFQQEDIEDTVRFYVFPVREVYIGEDRRGAVDTHYRVYKQTVRQLAQEFGKDALSKDSQDKLESKPDEEVEVVHATYPREDFNPNLAGPENMPWAGIYVEKANKHVLHESGYHENPWHTARWRKSSREVYGRGPGIDAMADIKMLNEQKKSNLRGGQKAVEPPLQVPANFSGRVVTTPNALNYFKPGTRDRIEPIKLVDGLPFGLELTNDTREQIKQAFFVDVFMMLASQTSQMTATEVVERVQERLMILGPALGRLHSEALGPLIERTFAIMARAGMFPPPPDALEGKRLDIEYESPLAKALKAMEGNALQNALAFAQPFIALDPQAADVFNADEAIRHAFELYGAPGEMLRDENEVAEIRQQRAMQQQLMAGIDTARQATEIDKLAAEAERARG